LYKIESIASFEYVKKVQTTSMKKSNLHKRKAIVRSFGIVVNQTNEGKNKQNMQKYLAFFCCSLHDNKKETKRRI